MARSFNHTYTKNDEMYTPKKLVDIIVPYVQRYSHHLAMYLLTCGFTGDKPYSYFTELIKNGKENSITTIWCPFDTENSEFVRTFKGMGYNVVHSHIDEGKDFFEYEPESWNIAISNPPFSKKDLVIERLLKFGKPFAMVMNMMVINYQCTGELLVGKGVQALVPDKKVSFDGHTSSFCSGYLCHDILPEGLVFCHMEDNNSGSSFVPAYEYTLKHGGLK